MFPVANNTLIWKMRHAALGQSHLCFSAVPFTPTQGICTPSPTNMAAYWYQAHYGFADPFGMYASAWSPVSSLPHAPTPSDAAPMTASSRYTELYCCLYNPLLARCEHQCRTYMSIWASKRQVLPHEIIKSNQP